MEMLSLKGAKRREGQWKMKGLIPWAGQGQCKWDTNEEASLQRERTTEGSSLLTLARLGSNLLSRCINTHTGGQYQHKKFKITHTHTHLSTPHPTPTPTLTTSSFIQ